MRWLALATLLIAPAAAAGPPYRTDDPVPVEPGHFEGFAFVSGTGLPGQASGESGLDLNFGIAGDAHINLVLPLAFQAGEDSRLGAGTVELAIKMRFLRQAEGSARPDIAFYPRVFLPTASNGLGAGDPALFLPVWAEKDFGPWSVFGGGGYQFNPGTDNRSFWSGGLAVTRDLGRRLNLGVEVYAQGRQARDTPASTLVNLGLTYRLGEHVSLLASGGPGLQNASQAGAYDFYLSLQAHY